MTPSASASAAPPGQRRSGLAGTLVLLAVVGLVAALFYFADFSRSVSLNRSAIGFEGLTVWLDRHEIDAGMFYGGDILAPESVGLRVLPLYDVDLSATSGRPQSDQERLFQETQRDLAQEVLAAKIRSLPTLVILPKWRSGVVETGSLQAQFLIPAVTVGRLVRREFPEVGPLSRGTGEPWTRDGPGGRTLALYHPQFVAAGACEPIIGDDQRMLLGSCKHDGDTFWLLADPDLLDNHGLSRGDNAALAIELLPELAAGGAIMVDVTTRVWTAVTADPADRSWADLARFLAFPFSIIWAGLVLLAMIVLWRAWRRYGPIDRESDRDLAPKASRAVSIDVKARMLRLTGHDAAIVRAHIGNRLQALVADILGPHRARGEGGLDALRAIVARRSPDLSDDLKKSSELSRISDKSTSDQLLNQVEHVDRLLTRIRNELGRS